MEKTLNTKSERDNAQVAHQILHNLMEVVDDNPEFTIAEHLCHLLRRKASHGPQFFQWSNKELLKRLEQYKKEIESEDFKLNEA